MDMPLSLIPVGTEAKLSKIIGGCNLTKRLTELGLICGTKIKVVSNSDTRLALGRGVAMKIFVEE